MFKKLFILLNTTAAILLLFTGCLHTYEKDLSPKKGEHSLWIKFTMPDTGSDTGTRSIPAEPGENNINDLTLLFFDYTNNGTGAFAGYYQVPEENIPAEGDMYGAEGNLFDLEVFFGGSLSLSVSKAYSILAFANAGKGNYFTDIYNELEFSRFIADIAIMQENDVRRTMIMQVQGVPATEAAQTDNSQFMDRTNLPMSAFCMKAAGADKVECDLVRAVVRYDVVNRAPGYTLTSVSIWNAYPYGYVFDYTNVDYTYSRLKRYYGVRDLQGLGDVYGGLYSFENVSTNPTQKDEKTTCLILGMRKEGDAEDEIFYYRVNLNPKASGQYLTRNNAYQVTISSVSGVGAPNEPDAYGSDKVLIDTHVNSWDRDEDGLIVRNETHMMALPTKRTNFGPEADNREFFIYTMGEGTLEMSILAMPDGMEARLVGNTLTVSVMYFGGDKRTGAVRFNFAGLTAVMEINQTGMLGKLLQLSHTQVSGWPAGMEWQNMIGENPVKVTSSGPWTATIYNDANNYFSFANGSGQYVKTGVSGDEIAEVYNTAKNTDPDMRHSFILVTLDEDPEHYRNVIVLTQLGSGSFTITPDVRHVVFDGDGTLASLSNIFKVYPGEESDTWTAEITGAHASSFEISFNGTEENGKRKGIGEFTVISSGDNFGIPLNASVIVRHNDVNEITITLAKEAYMFGLNYTVLDMGAIGGETVPVAVLCTKENATWSAEITSNTLPADDMQPFIVIDQGQGPEKVTSVTSQTTGNTFRVWMPPVIKKLDQPAIATVRVSLDGYPEQEVELVVTQPMYTPVPIYAQTLMDHYGNWARPERDEAFYVFGQWAKEMTNGANFGPAGEVYTPAIIDVSFQSSQEILTGANSVKPRIINMNGTKGTHGSRIDFAELRADPNTVFICYAWEQSHTHFNLLGLNDKYSFSKLGPNLDPRTRRLIYQAKHGNQYTHTELWKYIFQEGPFGPIDIDQVVLYPQYFYQYICYLNQWPDTFIPLIMLPKSTDDETPDPSKVLMGIDPANRLIWIGHKDIFGMNNGEHQEQYKNWSTEKEDNLKFLQHVIAWMVNVNNYGDAFNNRFKTGQP